MSAAAASPQVAAADPKVSAFVTANAGSGKTRTLVNRVARLLLRGGRPEAVLCLTYTKAAAAEMQRRLFETLGAWAVMEDRELERQLIAIGEEPHGLPRARALFAQALETPGGLKIQTIHAFCEKLLRRFPLEAGVSPGFQVLEDQAARTVSAAAREDVARAALQDPDGRIGRAYAHFAVELSFRAFNDMFAAFEARRREIAAYLERAGSGDGVAADVWRACGFDEVAPSADIEARAVAATDLAAFRRAAAALLQGTEKTDQPSGQRMLALADAGDIAFEDLWGEFSTDKGKPRASMATKGVDPVQKAWLEDTRDRLAEAASRIRAARTAETSVSALMLAAAYIELYSAAKGVNGALDFSDLIERTLELLTCRADAAWVLYKLDGGFDHILLDEAQDTAPDQWDIVWALVTEFFSGAGARADQRSLFAVGDEKQSIFSFQGADPRRFMHEKGRYRGLAQAVGARFVAPELAVSYRSTPQILAFVDAVFQAPEARLALGRAAEDPLVKHLADRTGAAGLVEFWPLAATVRPPDPDPWEPLDAEPAESGNKKLAALIALRIKAMVEGGEAVYQGDRLRPMTYGDVLILVRRRGALFHEIIRALKLKEVPVGGADRMTLSDHIVFSDLIGLGRFCLFPQDDLTLASLLRSPFCDLDEDSLYTLAHGRPLSLWARLLERADERPQWRSARDLLRSLRAEAWARAPFDFYARLLGRTDGAGRSMRARILTRLGREAEQALEAFLAEALKAERRGVRDLESFVADMAETAVEVKREQEDGRGEVRVMTVHGAKGLEAPVVILPDTTTKASVQGGPLLKTEAGGFLWCARKDDECAASAAARQGRSDAGDRESLRLLYVALTRARDRLILCGVEPGKPHLKQGSWWEWTETALSDPEIAPQLREIVLPDGETVRRLGADPVTVAAAPAPMAADLRSPDWLFSRAPAEPPSLAYASPSQMAEAQKGPAPSPLAAAGGLGRFRRGELIHRLLQLLPDVAPAERRAAAAALMAREHDLTPDQRDEMAAAALAVLEDEQFAAVFGPGSRAEAAIAGTAPELPAGLGVSGRLDRLVIEPDRLLVADFKTNRPAPARIEDADGAYITQMAVYAAVLRAAFPGRKVEAALVWTDGPKLMSVPEKLMAQALEALPRSR
jgi:ATP-dependent helicase/nuclease subunit A